MPFHIFGHRDKSDLLGTQSVPNSMATSIALPEDQRAQLASDLSMLDKADISRSQRLQKDVERSVIAAAEVTVKRLRDKLEDTPSNPRYLKTVYGVGYTWAVK